MAKPTLSNPQVDSATLSQEQVLEILSKARKGFQSACKKDPYLRQIAKKQGLI